MADIKETLKLLAALQKKDIALGRLRRKMKELPKKIDELRQQVAAIRGEFEGGKKSLMQMQLLRKDKEMELQAKEAAIRKHGNELNAVKTNEAYRALLAEIDNAKNAKGLLETDILELMDRIDRESARIREEEKTVTTREAAVQDEIAGIEAELKKEAVEADGKAKDRAEFARQVPADVLAKYDEIRKLRHGVGVAPLEGNVCSACKYQVRPQQIVEIGRGKEIIYCDSCSRMLYKKDEDQNIH